MIAALVADLQPSALTAPYWEAAARHQLMIQRCRECRSWQHPPRPVCLSCASTALDFEPVSGRATVYTFTVVERALVRALRDQIPYVLAVVSLVEGPRLMTLIRGCPAPDCRVGMDVVVEFEEVGAVTLPVFRPTPGDAA
jgi:uncharacterized OB-fold protein